MTASCSQRRGARRVTRPCQRGSGRASPCDSERVPSPRVRLVPTGSRTMIGRRRNRSGQALSAMTARGRGIPTQPQGPAGRHRGRGRCGRRKLHDELSHVRGHRGAAVVGEAHCGGMLGVRTKSAKPSGSAALRLAGGHEAGEGSHHVCSGAGDRCDTAGRRIRLERVDGASERSDRRLDGAALVWEVALSLDDDGVSVGFDLRERGLQGADLTGRAQAGRLVDRILEAGSSRAVGGLAATAATGERNQR